MPVTSEDDADGEAIRLGRASTSEHANQRFRHEPRDSPISRNDRRDNRNPDAPYSSASGSARGDDDDDDDDDDNEDGDFDDDDDDVEGDDDDPLPPPPPPSQNTFAPPFYGRPPTPLPPSPSLTSLLRPSRPTTPDASEDDGAGTGTGGGPDGAGGSSGRPRDPVPRARPKVPTYEYYGFVLYLFSSLSFLIYLLWSYLPSPFLHALGIYYYPNRWWSLAIPSWLVMLLVYIYVALAGYNTEILTLPLGSVETVVDEAAMVAVVDGEGRIVRGAGRGSGRRGEGRSRKEARISAVREEEDGRWRDGEGGLNWREVWNEGTDAVMDVPLAGVCEVLYGEGRAWDSDLEDDDVVITRV